MSRTRPQCGGLSTAHRGEDMKYRFTVHTIDGKEWESTVQDLDDFELAKWSQVVTNMKLMTHLTFPTVDALGRNTKVYFNPAHVVAIRITEETV